MSADSTGAEGAQGLPPSINLRRLESFKEGYVGALRSALQSISFLGGPGTENLMVAKFFDRAIVHAGAKQGHEIVEELRERNETA